VVAVSLLFFFFFYARVAEALAQQAPEAEKEKRD